MINNEFLELLKQDERVLYIYQYGSSVYGVTSEDSDTDFLVITESDYSVPDEYVEYAYEIEHIHEDRIIHNVKYKNCDFIFYKIEEWFEMMQNNCIELWECGSLTGPSNRKYIHKEYVKIIPKLDQIALRKEISAICSNAYVKAKKKIKQGDYYIGKKSLWHSIRVVLFGVQIVQNNKIINYKEANKYYEDIVLNPCNDWDYYENKYKKFCNNLRTEFREVTERQWTEYCKQKYLKENGNARNN